VLQVWDKDQLNDDFLGQAKLGTIRQLLSAQPGMAGGGRLPVRVQLGPREGKKDKDAKGELHLELQLLPDAGVSGNVLSALDSAFNAAHHRHDAGAHAASKLHALAHSHPKNEQAAPAPQLAPQDAGRRGGITGELQLSAQPPPPTVPVPGLLSMTIKKAMGLAAMDRGGTSDPYVTIKVGSQSEQKTTVQKKTLAPVWDESFSFRVESMDDALVLQVWDKDMMTDEFMGEVKLGTMRQLLSAHGAVLSVGVPLQVQLQSRESRKDKDVKGELHLNVRFAGGGMTDLGRRNDSRSNSRRGSHASIHFESDFGVPRSALASRRTSIASASGTQSHVQTHSRRASFVSNVTSHRSNASGV